MDEQMQVDQAPTRKRKASDLKIMNREQQHKFAVMLSRDFEKSKINNV